MQLSSSLNLAQRLRALQGFEGRIRVEQAGVNVGREGERVKRLEEKRSTPSLIGLQAATEQAAGLAAMPQTIPAPMSTPASKITASTVYAGMNKDACQQGNSMIGEQLRGYQQTSLLFNVVPTAEGPGVAKRKLFSSPHFSSSPRSNKLKMAALKAKVKRLEKNCNKSKKTEFRIKLEGEGSQWPHHLNCQQLFKRYTRHSIKTLQSYQNKIDIEPGLMQLVLTTLKSLAAGFLSDRSENVCSLIIDEIAIRQQLHYDSKSDMIKGFADDGIARYPMKIGNHCLMAMVKGIKKGWKQVKLATQVFSYSVHTAIHAYVGMGKLPISALHTADFIEMMDKLFDTFNSTKLKTDKFKYRFAITPDSIHAEFLKKTLNDIQSLEFVGCKSQPACLEGWRISIQSLLNLFDELSSEYNIPKLRTRFLSQDALENTFATIRQQHGCNVNPSVQQLESGLRHILITSLSKLSHRSNCEKDVEYVLTKLNSISVSDKAVQESSSVTDVNCISDCTPDTIVEMDVECDTGSIEDDNAVYYIAGYICSRFLKKHKCSHCKNTLTLGESQRELSESHQIFTYFKAFDDDFGSLSLPRNEVFTQFREWENSFCRHFKANCHCKNLRTVMKKYVLND
ncbi:hypothetical protein ANN_26242 [Periplaneta americana]|uniref:Transposable element P transposase n=1 Tax=Periplaneta americana TaxID=6978 RepID=A0ABQ8S5D7_PERAM|nr:hypothetical protein ANN_26242 [Periplaneta americana]